jgi:short-subunit dehydrogenase
MRVQFDELYGPWAFIAGASMGIGAAFSHEAAARGLNVVMMARGEELLLKTADEVRSQHGVEVRTVAADLGDPNIGAIVDQITNDIEVGLFVYNATVAPAGRFLDVPLDVQLASVEVNCSSLLRLLHVFAPKMAARGRGGIGIVSSLAGTQGSVRFGTYNSAKAYQWILAETLWSELGDSGVHVNNIFVGATASPNYNSFKETLDVELCNRYNDDALDRARWRLMHPAEPHDVALALYDKLADGPICFTNEDDEFVGLASLAMSRVEAVEMWRKLQETSVRIADQQAV